MTLEKEKEHFLKYINEKDSLIKIIEEKLNNYEKYEKNCNYPRQVNPSDINQIVNPTFNKSNISISRSFTSVGPCISKLKLGQFVCFI